MYRGADESPDREGVALEELGQRRTRLRARVLLPFIVGGIVVGIPGFWVVRELQFAATGYAWLPLTAGLGCGLPFVAFAMAGAAVARRLVKARTGAWLDELAGKYKVKRERLAEIAEMVNAAEGGSP